MGMKISVLIPTYKRPKDLLRCLHSIENQIRPPDEVVVVTRDNDFESQEALRRYMKSSEFIKNVHVSQPGIVNAENRGLRDATGDVICFVDDDSTVFPDLLERIEKYYLSDENIGGVGGRVFCYMDGVPFKSKRVEMVGKVEWFGRFVGNLYQDVDGVKWVDFLCGDNMSFRRDLVDKIDDNLLGNDSSFEVDICLRIKEQGYKIVYDPDIKTSHFDTYQDIGVAVERFFTNGHNHTYVLLKHFSLIRKIIFLCYFFIVGDSSSPGIVKVFHLICRGGSLRPFGYLLAATKGKIKGVKTYEKRCNF